MNLVDPVIIRDAKLMGSTYWWKCMWCGHMVHTTIRNEAGGRDFPCGCGVRHCMTWTRDVEIYSYDPFTVDKNKLPPLAQLS